ncbi:MAG: glycosyltransferase family 2 protein, partial [Nitrososphaerota archaeon]|nr:glycosyltransferase family 2 protein [Nitrososphaerota archaeon]
MKTSVIIVSWQSRLVLNECLQSINGQVQEDREIIVVDNNSGDGTIEMIRSQFGYVILIESKINSGFSAANNLAISTARGKYGLFLNPDTLVNSGTISEMESYLDSHPECMAVGPRVVDLDGNFSKPSVRRLPTIWYEFADLFFLNRLLSRSRLFNGQYYPDSDRGNIINAECLVGAALMVRLEAVRSLGGFDESVPLYLDDIDLCARLSKLGNLVYLPSATVKHHHNASGRKQPLSLIVELGLQARFVFLKKHNGKSQARGYVVLVFLRGAIQ